MASLYEYSPLLHNRVIRLFKFEPSHEFRIKISTADLDNDCPSFETISYTWGAPFNTQSSIEDYAVESWVKVSADDGVKSLKVQRNLFEALKQLKSRGVEGYLWADGICINQFDMAERVLHVVEMGQIYAQAQRVIAWVGKADDCTEDVVWFHQIFWNRIQESSELTPLQLAQNSKELADELENKDPSGKWASLIRFYMHCRYFSRAWVAQEITISNEIVLLYGNHQIDWPALVGLNQICRLTDLAYLFYILDHQEAVGTGGAAELEFLDHLRRSHIQGGPDSEHMSSLLTRVYGAHTAKERRYAYFEWLLTYSRRFQATILHDQVCSIIGILVVYLPDEKIIVPDYEQDPVRFFTYVAERLLSVAPSLTLLSLVEDPSLRRLRSLPSWVPDFSAQHYVELTQLWFQERLACLEGLDTNRNWIARNGHLVVRAYRLDVIRTEGHAMESNAGNFLKHGILKTGDIIQFLLSHLQILASMDKVYKDGHSALHALICVLEASMVYDAIDERVHIFRDLIKTMLGRGMQLSQGSEERDPWNLNYQEALEDALKLLNELAPFGLPTREDVEAYFKILCIPSKSRSSSEQKLCDSLVVAESRFGALIARIQELRRTIMTQEGYIGLGPLSSRKGDEILLIQGARIPFILRRTADQQYELVGETFIHGVMQGEVVPNIDMKDFREIVIV